MRINNLTLCAGIALALFSSCGSSKRTLPTSDEFPVITIGASNAQLKTTYPATIKGIQDVEVRPKVSGFITKLYIHEGEAVRAGQLLFVIDNSTFQAAVEQAQAQVNSAQSAVSQAKARVVQANASLTSAQAQAATAKLTYDNSNSLYASKVIGDYELQTAKNTHETAMAAINQANSGIVSARAAVNQAESGVKQAQAMLSSAKDNLSFCYVKSPTTGYVGSLPYKEGALVSPSIAQPVTTISNVSTMEVYFSMTEADVLKLSRSNNGLNNAIKSFPSVSLKLADGSIYNHEGTIVKTSGIINPSTGTVSVIARFANPEHLLKSGGSGQIIIARSDNNVLQIPQDATTQVQDKIFVYKVDSENKLHYSEITVNPQNDGMKYIVTSGLKMGERIVIKGLTTLQDGMTIKPVSEAEYEAIIKKAEGLGEKQKTAAGFIEAMTSGEKKK